MNRIGAAIAEAAENLDATLDDDIRVTQKADGSKKLSLFVDGLEVSWTGITAFRQQIGSGVVKMAGIGGVYTRDELRLKGYSRRVMDNALRWMRREGFDTSMLFGIEKFYPKFGFAPAFPAIAFTLALRDAETVAGGDARFVDYRPEYLKAVLKMYQGNSAGRTGIMRREARTWRPFRRGVCRVVLDGRKAPAGYFVYDANRPTPAVLEVGYRSPGIFPDILAAIARMVWEQRLERITFSLPEDHAFMQFCQPLGMQKTVTYRRDGNAMVRMINTRAALQSVAGELSARMSGSGQLDIVTNMDSAGVRWGGGRFSAGKPFGGRAVRMPQWALAQMFYGYRNASSLADAGVARGAARCVKLLDEMFPVTPHYFYLVDEF